jgi:hypothetical protein
MDPASDKEPGQPPEQKKRRGRPCGPLKKVSVYRADSGLVRIPRQDLSGLGCSFKCGQAGDSQPAPPARTVNNLNNETFPNDPSDFDPGAPAHNGLHADAFPTAAQAANVSALPQLTPIELAYRLQLLKACPSRMPPGVPSGKVERQASFCFPLYDGKKAAWTSTNSCFLAFGL